MKSMNFAQFESYSSGVKWEQGGWIFIRGSKNSEGKNYLFAAPAKYIDNLARYKSSGKSGAPANMVTFYPEFYGIGMDKFSNPVAIKVPSDPEYLKKWMGLSNPNVVLNNNKTPFWKVTITNKSLNKVLKDHEMWFRNDKSLVFPFVKEKNSIS